MSLSGVLKPYIFHGIVLSVKGQEASGNCPLCSQDQKFSVNTSTGQWRCWKCGDSGNVWTFLKKFRDLCIQSTSVEDYGILRDDLGLLDSQPLIEWEISKSTLTGDWLIPGYSAKLNLTSLYRYILQSSGGCRLIPTPTLGHHIHGMNLWNPEKPSVYICEGWKDALILWESLVRSKNSDQGLKATSSTESSLYAQSNVIAVPGCEVFFENWLPLFNGKVVNLMYDSDHPRKHPTTGDISHGAGRRAVEKITKMLSSSQYRPQEINFLKWGEDGYDPARKSGFDLRDLLIKGRPE